MFGTRKSLRSLIESDRQFMRELVLRMERSERAILADAAETRSVLAQRMAHEERLIVAEAEKNRRAFEQSMAEIKAELIEGRAEQQASREALFRILDRLGPGDAPA